MPKPDSSFAWRAASALLVFAFFAGAIALLDFAFARSNAYPPYSSFRADPVGAKALHDSLRTLPSLTVDRNLLRRISAQPGATYLFLGLSPAAFRNAPKAQLAEWEQIAQSGGRLILGFTPVDPITVSRTGPFAASLPAQYEVEKRWDLRTRWLIDRVERSSSKMPRTSAFNFELPAGPPWQCRALHPQAGCDWLERPFGRGSLVLLAQTFPLSNEGLLNPNGDLITQIIGPSRHIVFDEQHLGVVESGSVGALIRRYRLAGAALILVLTGLLFIWRQSGHFLPERPLSPRAALVNLNASTGLVNLLRRHIPPSRLIAACAAEWKRSLAVLPYAQRHRASRLDAALAQPSDPLAQYRTIVRSLHE